VLATSGPWFDRRRPENTWPSIVISIGITCGLFVSAFLAMQTVGRWSGARSEPPEPPLVVRLDPPPTVDRARPLTQRRVVAPSPAAPPRTLPEPQTNPTSVAPPVVPATAAPPSAAPASADTATAKASSSPSIPRGIIAPVRAGVDIPYTTPPGVGGAPSGVTIGSRTANTQAFRDSVLTKKMQSFPAMAAAHEPTRQELAELRLSQETARMTYRRVGTAGNPNVHVQQGEGRGGEGAVGGSPLMQSGGRRGSASAADVIRAGGGSVGLPFLSPGPSAAQRKKNEAIDREYRLGLRRLEDRLALKRDSIRLDSLRRDSLARRRP
jgi:hypothetical protein